LTQNGGALVGSVGVRDIERRSEKDGAECKHFPSPWKAYAMATQLAFENGVFALCFRGGAELLFDGKRKHRVTLPSQHEPWDVRHLLVWIKENLLKERPELFVQGDSV
ncbi:Ubiquitin-related modifier 1, partial [Varanus komodoensis]